MNSKVNYIKNRLSLRPPQSDSLHILAELTEKLILKKNANLFEELEKVRATYPTCSDFERTFPSVCFSLATGVGKTRLMGAFIAYLFLHKGIRNFFVLSPNLTIYNKLIDDFSNTSSPKYVFQGIGEFVHKQPRIITGDNYNTVSQTALFESEIHINVFNISKINADSKATTSKGVKLPPRIKRMSEYLGDSYFNYLSNLNDLVLLMDESHHYRADRGLEVLNELNPIIGLELTATPQVEKAGGAIKFKNVVYEYSLAKAIRDGFVKEPAVATRKDFDPSQYSVEDLDRIKLEDGIRIHEDTKVGLDIFSRDNKTRLVKPFVLVVAQHTEHARKLKTLITSLSFFDGYYADKVMEIHSNQSGEEKDENIAQLLSLESPENKIEIVIHVNMLKEGWDVTNLYTIIPLRTAASMTLREQTIGRGLRLPYGIRTGNKKADKLTIVAHDKFQAIIDEANKPDSIIKKENIIEIDAKELEQKKEVVTSVSTTERKFEEEQKKIDSIQKPAERQEAQIKLDVKKEVLEIAGTLNTVVKNVSELTSKEIQKIAVTNYIEKLEKAPQQDLFKEQKVEEFMEQYAKVVKEDFIPNIIEIPRILIQPSGPSRAGFKDFNLNVKNLNYQPVSEEILVRLLREQEGDTETILGKGGFVADSYERIIVNELMNYPEVDYDSQADLLFKLGKQAVEKFQSYLVEDKMLNVIQYHKKEIGRYIYSQLMENFFVEAPTFKKPEVFPFTQITQHNYSKFTQDKIYHYTETIQPTSAIPTKLFTGFKKSYHDCYKFDSKTEKDFAIILEKDNAVLKWLRPASNQFQIYWHHNSRQYQPDFVAETPDAIYLIETKKQTDIETAEVQDKSRAALEYCKSASEFTASNGGKPWKYILIPHNAVLLNMSFEMLVKQWAVKG